MRALQTLTGKAIASAVAVFATVALVSTACLPNSDISAKSGGGNNDGRGLPTALLFNVRAGAHPNDEGGYDRIVWDFVNFVPEYKVEYVPVADVRYSPSDQPVDLGGDRALRVVMRNASTFLQTPIGSGSVREYLGSERIQTRQLRGVVEAVLTEDFEGTLVWTLGVRSVAGGGALPFRVEVLDSPHRLVIDVAYDTNV